MSESKRSKRTRVVTAEVDMAEEDCLPTHLDEWQKADKRTRTRLAAKWRRDREVEYLDKLSELLPFPPDVTAHLDKGSILRLTITYLQLKNEIANVINGTAGCNMKMAALNQSMNSMKNDHESRLANSVSKASMLNVNESQLMLEALGGFLIYVSRKERILYVSENVDAHLGFNHFDMIGKKVLSFIHQDDHKELIKQFMISPRSTQMLTTQAAEDLMPSTDDPDCIDSSIFEHERKPFYLRLRYQITRKNSKTKQNGYLLSQWNGRIRLAPSRKHPGYYSIDGMVVICRPLQTASMLEIRLDGNMFMSRHNLDMKFIYCDSRIVTLIGYEPNELIGKTAYHFHNPIDAPKIQNCHSTLIVRGQSVSKYYRFLGKTGEWVWMQTRATIIYNTTNQPQYVVCMNYVIGQDEGRRHLMMEQDDVKDQDLARGAIDVTNLSSPGQASSSGYCSADEDHSYFNSKTRETYSPEAYSPHNTPPSQHPLSGLHNMLTPCMNEDRMTDLTDVETNLFDMIANSLEAGNSLPDSWLPAFDNDDIEMLDLDSRISSSLDGSDGLLANMIKDSEKHNALANNKEASISSGMMSTPCTSAVITQSNVMLSSATSHHKYGATSCSGSNLKLQNLNNLVKNNSMPRSIPSSMDTSGMGRSVGSMSVSEFPAGLLDIADGESIDSGSVFAVKFAENMVDQQINATLARYLTDADLAMDTANSSVSESSFTDLTNGTFKFLSDPPITANNSLSQFLSTTTTSHRITSSASQPCFSMIQNARSSGFVAPRGPPPMSARHTSKSQPSSPKSRTFTANPLHKVSSASTGSKMSYPGCDDHRYTSKQLESPPPKASRNNHYRPSNGHRHNHNNHHIGHSNGHPPRLLEQFLLTKEKLNPNKGSDDALAAHGLSKLHLNENGSNGSMTNGRLDIGDIIDGNQQLLKKLLTEEIQPKDVHMAQQEMIMDRRQSAGSSPTCGSPTLMPQFSLDPDDLANSIQLLGEDSASEMDKLWAPPAGDEVLPSELDDILREETRQNDLWLQHCINELL